MEELVIVVQTMVGEDLREKEAQSLKEYVEEVVKLVPQKPKKKKTWKDEVGLNKAKDHERTLSPIKQKKEKTNAPSGGFAKATIKVRLPNSFVGKEIKTKRVYTTPLGVLGRDGALELTQGDDKGLLAAYVQDFNCMLIVVPLKDEYA
ncbi:unnamed protein product [Sphagnum balticum]